MTIGDLYQVVASGPIATIETWSATFFYEITAQSDNITAQEVADNFVANLLDDILSGMQDQISCNNVATVDLGDDDNWNVTNPSADGALTGDLMPTTLAMGFRSPWPGPGYNRAAKRLPVGLVSWLATDGSWSSSFDTIPATIAASLGADMTLTDGTLRPVTVKKTYSMGAYVSAERRAFVDGDWEWNRFPTTGKARQVYLWEDPNA